MRRCAASWLRSCARCRPPRSKDCASSAARPPRPSSTRSFASPCTCVQVWKTRKGRDPMSAMRCMLLIFALAACATPGPVDEARRHYAEGRGEEALALLEQTMKARPADHAVRGEYFRLRDVVVGQWLAQADSLRSSGQFEMAEALYERVRKYDAANARAAAGLAQIEADRRPRTTVRAAKHSM